MNTDCEETLKLYAVNVVGRVFHHGEDFCLVAFGLAAISAVEMFIDYAPRSKDCSETAPLAFARVKRAFWRDK